jgi:hypothetical protein
MLVPAVVLAIPAMAVATVPTVPVIPATMLVMAPVAVMPAVAIKAAITITAAIKVAMAVAPGHLLCRYAETDVDARRSGKGSGGQAQHQDRQAGNQNFLHDRSPFQFQLPPAARNGSPVCEPSFRLDD